MNRILIQTAVITLLLSSAYAQNSNDTNSQHGCDRHCEIDTWIFIMPAAVACCIIVVLYSIYHCCVRPVIMRKRRLRKPPNPESPKSTDIEAQDFGRSTSEGLYGPPAGPPPHYTPLNAAVDPNEINALRLPCYSPTSFWYLVPPPPAHTRVHRERTDNAQVREQFA